MKQNDSKGKTLVLAILCFFLSSQLWAQGGFHIYGNTDSQIGGMVRLNSGEVILSGIEETNGLTSRTFFLTKLTSGGSIIWDKRFQMNFTQYNFTAIPTSDGGFFGAGMVIAVGQPSDLLALKLDANGNVSWATQIGGAENEWFGDIAESSAGNFVVAGYSSTHGTYASPTPSPSQPDAILLELSQTGTLNWARSYGGVFGDKFYRMIRTTTGYVIVGRAWQSALDGFLVATDHFGVPSHRLRFSTSTSERFFEVMATSDGGYLLTGHYKTGNDDLLLVKLNSSFGLQWSKTYATAGREYGANLLEKGGSYYVSGNVNSFSGNEDALLLKTDLNGNLLWARIYDGGSNDFNGNLYDLGGANILASMRSTSFGNGLNDLATFEISDVLDSCAMDVTAQITVANRPLSVSNYGVTADVTATVPTYPISVSNIPGNLLRSYVSCTVGPGPDTTAPVIVCPVDLMAICGDLVQPADPFDATTTDDRDSFPTVTVTETSNNASGCAGDPLLITRTYLATDSSGNSSSCTQTITVESSPLILTVSPEQVVFPAFQDSSCAQLGVVATGSCGPYTYLWSTGATTTQIQVCPTTRTIYTVLVTDAQGCFMTDSVQVCAIGLACVAQRGRGQSRIQMCHRPPGNPANGQTMCLPIPAVKSHLQNGHGGDHLGACGTLASRSCTLGANKSLPEVMAQAEVQFYPNPFSAQITFALRLEAEENVSLTIIDMQGRTLAELYAGRMESGKHQIKWDGQRVPVGIYFVRIRLGDRLEVRKIQKI